MNRFRFVILKPGYVHEDGTVTEPEAVRSVHSEKMAVSVLEKSPEELCVRKEEWTHVSGSHYEWRSVEGYGEKFLSDIL